MRDISGSNPARPATFSIPFASALSERTLRLPRRPMLVLIPIAAVLICAAQAVLVAGNTIPGSGFGYLAVSLVMLGPALAFGSRAQNARGFLHIRWTIMTAAALMASVGYLPSFAQAVFNTPPQRVLQLTCFNASEALYMLAAVLFFSKVGRSIVLVDSLQALLFILLRFNLVYSPVSRDHFTIDHLTVSFFLALFLFLVATVACLGAASRAELAFLRTLSWFFGLRLIQYFLSNQVSYTWLHYTNCSLWDVPGSVLLAGFSIYILYTAPAPGALAVVNAARHRSVMVSSLMPSFLALVNLILGLFLLPTSVTLAAVAMSVSLLCYVARTVLLQAQSMKEKAVLETQNEHLEGLAIRDPLTGIGNRRSLAGVYRNLQTLPRSQCLSLLLMDIDQFKQANDHHGHQHGDQVLIALAQTLQKAATGIPGSHCARLGGDEFALLLLDVTPEAAAALAQQLRATAFGASKFAPAINTVTLSIGIASLQSAHDLPLETLACHADEALYRAKRLGRNRVEVQSPGEPRTAPDSPAPEGLLTLQRSAG
jgi:diguanylate cyclase (GGDEF)-like protein